MNKDFFPKQISLKDINLKDFDIKKIKNKKEIVITILVIIYIIVICVIGSSLLDARAEAKSQYELKESKYISLQNSLSEEEIKKQIEEIEEEKEIINSRIAQMDSNEFSKIFEDFKSGAPITWEKEEIDLRMETKGFEDYDIYVVNIGVFSGSFEQVEEFLEYVVNYDKIVRVDTLSIKKNPTTGKMAGQLKLSFYFKKLSI